VSTPDRSPSARLLAVRPGEWPIVAWSALYFFFLLLSYFLLRPVRESLGSRELDKLPWLMTGTMIAMVAVNPAFAWLVSRMPRRRFIPLVNRFFILNLLVFAALITWVNAKWVAYSFYIWVSVYNLFVVSIFWAFMADSHGPERSRRVFGLIGVGGTAGAIVGAWLTQQLVNGFAGHLPKVEPAGMLVASIIALEVAVQCMRQVARRTPDIPPGATSSTAEPTSGTMEGLVLILRSPYLACICLYVFVFAVTSTFLYFEQAAMIKAAFPDDKARTAAFANLDMWTQSATLLAQVFITSRAIKWLGVGVSLALLPIVTLVGFAVLGAPPTLTVLMWFQVIRTATHRAVDRPTRETLFTVVSADARYKSKTLIDTFIYRGGDVAGTWLPKYLAHVGVLITPIAIAAAIAWAGLAFALGIMNNRRREQRVLYVPTRE
jgi:AAA family ATP:ADP antiporter